MAQSPNIDLYLPNRIDNVEVDTTLASNFTKIDAKFGDHTKQLADIAISVDKFYSGEDDNYTSAITSALEYCKTNQIHKLSFLKDKTYYHSGILIDSMPSFKIEIGNNTVLKLKDNINKHSIHIKNSSFAEVINNGTINGNGQNNLTSGDGVHIEDSQLCFVTGRIIYPRGKGVTSNMLEQIFDKIIVLNSGDIGIEIPTDSIASNLDVGGTGGDGIRFIGGNVVASNCYSWMAGNNHALEIYNNNADAISYGSGYVDAVGMRASAAMRYGHNFTAALACNVVGSAYSCGLATNKEGIGVYLGNCHRSNISIACGNYQPYTAGNDYGWIKYGAWVKDSTDVQGNILTINSDYSIVENIHYESVLSFEYLKNNIDIKQLFKLIGKKQKFRNAGNQLVTNSLYTKLTYPSTVWDTGGSFTVGADGTITCVENGVYSLDGNISFQSDINGIRIIKVNQNGAEILSKTVNATTGMFNTDIDFSTKVWVNAGDTLAIEVYQTSGVDLNITSSSVILVGLGI